MRTTRQTLLPVVAMVFLYASWAAGPELDRLTAAQLCVTEGRLDTLSSGRLAVAESKFRAVAKHAGDSAAELRFTYLGPTSRTSALGSGAVREQLGLKLRAQDPCNLVYVMWRISPESKLVVSIKENPGQHTSAECGNRGYHNLKPEHTSPLPALTAGSSKTLSARIHGDRLQVHVGQVVVWEGRISGDALSWSGPVGLRSDNVRFEFDFYAPASGGSVPCPLHGDE